MAHQRPDHGYTSGRAGYAPGADTRRPACDARGTSNCRTGNTRRSIACRTSAGQSQPETMKVAILGGGPSGAFAAAQLASNGVRAVVFDEKLAWEKPCGGGLTWKAYSQYPFLAENETPRSEE